jgi:transcriptional regulator with XRE-family HTH domain
MSETGRIYPLRRPAARPPAVQRPAAEPPVLEPPVLEPLWREVLGSRLRALRAEREETLAQTADRAGISPQYLSEIERGRKEASSEMIAALAGALGTTVADLMAGTAEDLRRATTTIFAIGSGTAGSRLAGLPGRGLERSRQRPSGPVALAA